MYISCTVEPLYYGHHWDHIKCFDSRGVLFSEVVLYASLCTPVVGTTGSVSPNPIPSFLFIIIVYVQALQLFVPLSKTSDNLYVYFCLIIYNYSMSGYDSETALVSQSSLEQGETHVIISLNSSLTRFILILDIWLTQVHVYVHAKCYACTGTRDIHDMLHVQ